MERKDESYPPNPAKKKAVSWFLCRDFEQRTSVQSRQHIIPMKFCSFVDVLTLQVLELLKHCFSSPESLWGHQVQVLIHAKEHIETGFYKTKCQWEHWARKYGITLKSYLIPGMQAGGPGKLTDHCALGKPARPLTLPSHPETSNSRNCACGRKMSKEGNQIYLKSQRTRLGEGKAVSGSFSSSLVG